MNKKIPALLIAVSAASADLAQAQTPTAPERPPQTSASRWISEINTDVRYYSWSNSLGGTGIQLYAPVAAQLTGRPSDDWKLEFLVRSGTIWSRQSTPTATVQASGFTDTAVSSTTTYFGFNGIQPFISMNINVPTGNSSAGTTSTTKNDSDIVATPIFGEGWNFGPSIGTSFAINQSFIATLSVGYVNRGPFNEGPTATSGPLRLNPGDVTTINGGIGYRGDRWTSQASVSYSMETTTTADGMPLYQSGDRVIANLKAGYALSENWSSRFSGSFSHFGKNKVPVSATIPVLVREAFNSNSDVYRVSVDLTYNKDNYSIGPTASYLYRDRNGYDPVTFQFIPAKESWSAGLVAQVAATDRISINARVERIWVHEDTNPDKIDLFNAVIPGSGVPESSTDAWVMSVGGSVRF